MVCSLVVCGGTFDHFHKGHEDFLNYALSLGAKVIIGITSDKYVEDLKANILNSNSEEQYEIRKKSVDEFLFQKNAQDKASIIKINNLFGPTLSKDLLAGAIVVSPNSEKGAKIINQERMKLGLNPLEVFTCSLSKAEDEMSISSARIRNGEIDRNGKLYINPLWLKTDLVLKKNSREEFKKPIGLLLQDVNFEKILSLPFVITVGDETSKKFNKNFAKQKVSVIDFKVAREEKFSSFSELGFEGDEKIYMVNNPGGCIMSELFSVAAKLFGVDSKSRTILKVDGEEDLAVLPFILAAPLGAVIYYGQPNQGLVEVIISEETKNTAYNLVSKMHPI